MFSSKDLCMIEHIPDLISAGIDSFKIEGRVKSAYYAAITANAYKNEVNAYFADPENYVFDKNHLYDLECVSHREYGTGFFYDDCSENAQITSDGGYIKDKAFLSTVESVDEKSGRATLVQRNKSFEGQECELISPGKSYVPFILEDLRDESGQKIDSSPHPQMVFSVKMNIPMKKGDIIRGK